MQNVHRPARSFAATQREFQGAQNLALLKFTSAKASTPSSSDGSPPTSAASAHPVPHQLASPYSGTVKREHRDYPIPFRRIAELHFSASTMALASSP